MNAPAASGLAKVSIHIIAYNQKHFIREAIESALAQDYPAVEVVVADDASTDGTAEIIAEYERAHPGRVVAVLNRVNRGITANSNSGLRACSGTYIAFLGGDDVLLPGKISAQVAWFAAHPNGVLCGHQVEVFHDDDSVAPYPLSRQLLRGTGADAIIRHQPFGALSVMVRADRIPPHGFDEALPVVSDQLLWTEVVRDDGEFGFVEGTWSRYRRHGANVTRDPFANLGDVESTLGIVAQRYPQFRGAVRYAVTRRLLYDVGVALMDAGRKSEARRKFWEAIRREPWFAKAWIRLAQTLV
jgi:glycosyltransferase involved in cell wall biosynthesis